MQMKRAVALLSTGCGKTQAHPQGPSRLLRNPLAVNELCDSLRANCSFQD